ncbi:hypothetical protein D047_0562B, partial [Vibrio parahaemolyticus VPTS-2010_2]
ESQSILYRLQLL